jgi:hypothetical protein
MHGLRRIAEVMVGELGSRGDRPSRSSFQTTRGVTGPKLVQELLEDRAVAAGAAGRLDKHPVAAGTLQGVDLELGVLVGSGDAGVAEQASHGVRPPVHTE